MPRYNSRKDITEALDNLKSLMENQKGNPIKDKDFRKYYELAKATVFPFDAVIEEQPDYLSGEELSYILLGSIVYVWNKHVLKKETL